MPGDYKGFRIWNLEFQAMTPDQTGVEVERVVPGDTTSAPTGRLTNTVNNTKYWSEDNNGLSRHLEDYLRPMWDNTNIEYANGVGWSLDTALYDRLYAIIQANDPLYSDFITRNTDLYSSTNTSGQKTILLAPTTYTRVMCFKHTSGYKAMIGLSLYAIDSQDYLNNTVSKPTVGYQSIVDPGFLNRHIYNEKRSITGSSYINSIGGLFISVIPPANEGEIQDDWHLEYSIKLENFFSPTSTPIIPMIHGSNITSSYDNGFSCSSWLHIGTTTEYNSNSKICGIVSGTNMKLSLLLDTLGNIGLSYKYTYSTNTTYLNPIILVGPLFSKKINTYLDTLCTRNIGVITQSIDGYSNYNSSSSVNNSAWNGGGNSYYNYFYTDRNLFYYIGGFTEDGSSVDRYAVYTAYPALDSGVYTNYRYTKSGYTTLGLINDEILRWSNENGLLKGQTYNDNQWVFLGNLYNIRAENGTTSSTFLYPSLRWDGDFNGTKTFV